MNPALLLDPKGARKRGSLPNSITSTTSSSPSHTASQPVQMADMTQEAMLDDSKEPHHATSGSSSHSQSSSPSNSVYEPAKQQRGNQEFPIHIMEAPAESPLEEMDLDKIEHELTEEGDAATQNPDNRAKPQVQPAFDPQALLNPKAATKRTASDSTSDRGREDAAEAGQISLVERLHNVHQRTASPAKRVKTDDEHQKQQLKPNVPGGGGALDFNPQAQPDPQIQSTAIDLTMSDDDEVQIVKDNRMEMICIGRVKQAYVQSHVVPFPDPQKYRGNNGSQGCIKVAFRRGGVQRTTNIILVADATGREFGRVDTKTAQGLAPLMDCSKQNGLMWMAMTEQRRKQPNEGPPGSALSTLITLTLQLYCPRKVAHEIGRYLKTKTIFLGDPVIELQKYDYFNPQTSNQFSSKDASQSEFAAGSHGGSQYAAAPSYVLRSVEEIRSDVLNMFDNIENPENMPQREQSSVIKTQLMKHQKQALHFMVDKESEWTDEKETRKDSLYQAKVRDNGRKYYVHVITGEEMRQKPESTRGGILADEMGLGKTLSILALISDKDSMNTARVFATKTAPMLPNGGRRQVVNSRATLLLCPLSTMVNWKQQLGDHFLPNQCLKWSFYHGTERKKFTPQSLADHDLIITTYHMVAADAFDPKKPLSYVNWFRIVLDEAHTIRSGTSKQARGVYELAALRRWAVTGTPVQNRLEDLGALFKFLRIKPFNETSGFNQYILNAFKNADPDVVPKLQLLVSSLTLRRVKENNPDIELPSRTDQVVRLQFSEDERRLHEWFEQDSRRKMNAMTSGEKLGGHAYARILKAILYLRLICAHGRDLLGDEALKLTEGMTSENPMEVEGDQDQVPAMTRKSAYEMLDLLDQTDSDRCQYTSCRSFILEPDSDDDDDDYENDEETDDGIGEQSNKGDKSDTIGFMTPCYHIICLRHVKKLKKEWGQVTTEDGCVTCQFCEGRTRPVLFELKRSDWKAFLEERERIKKDPKLAKKMGAYTGPHTKTKALLGELQKSHEESLATPLEPPIKSVIFSCWTTHLDLIQIALDNHGHKYTRLDGRMDRKARDRALTAFANDASIPIILVSIGAGGLGLNLTSANKVYVMEPQFNPAAEAQAVDRVHRLGQKRPVTINRYIMENSFEEKMQELQRKKKALADLTMAREKTSKEQQAKKRLEDLRSLFR